MLWPINNSSCGLYGSESLSSVCNTVSRKAPVYTGSCASGERASAWVSLHADKPVLSNSSQLSIEQIIDKVKHKTNISMGHLGPLQGVAKEHNCIIGVRPVEAAATGLIEDEHPTKGFHIKGKSADWGPQAGMICVDQAFSKLERYIRSDSNRVAKFNEQIRQCLEKGHAVAVPLVMTAQRLGMLLADKIVTEMKVSDVQHVIKLSAQGPSSETYRFEALRQPAVDGDTYMITQGGKPLEVLGKKETGKALTADYDLLLIGPYINDLGPEDNLPVPDIAHSVFKERIDGYRRRDDERNAKLAKSVAYEVPKDLREGYEGVEVFYAKEDPDIGNATTRIRKMMNVINQAVVGDGERVVQHSADSGNPVTDVNANYPATFFLPARLGKFDEICVVENSRELVELIQQAKNSGYHIPLNPLWEPEVIKVRRADFGRVQAQFNRV